MTVMCAVDGWRFYCADFSCDGKEGTVLFMRDAEQTARWHKLDDEGRDATELYVQGKGFTFEEAFADAVRKASSCLMINA